MPSQSELVHLEPEDRRVYGFLRVRDAAFDAVSSLWKRRQNEGMTQAQIAAAIDSDEGWVSKNLRGPGNWTMKTFGALVEALNGEVVQINVRANEDPLPILTNYHAYVGYEPEIPATSADHSAVNVARGVRMPAASHTTAKGSGPSAVILIP